MTDGIFDNINDEDLFVQFRDKSDEKAFNALYNRFSRKVLSYCLRANPNRDTAYDVYQKVWSAVVEKKKYFVGGSFVAWLMVITRNFCLMEKRNIKNFVELKNDSIITEENVYYHDIINLLSVEIQKLPDEFKEIICYRYFDDFSYKELAEILNISIPNVKVRLFRAKKILGERLSFLFEDLK